MSKTFTYTQDGLEYTVTVSEEDGVIKATVTMLEGQMDVNAIYWGDDDFSDDSVSLGGPLNMNGGGSRFEGERIQWDGAQELSRPGLGREGQDKETFLLEGESLTFDLDDVDSLDDIDFIGIRATSVNGGDSIKGVSGNPEEHDDSGDNGGDDDPATYDKVAFGITLGDNENFILDGNNVFFSDLPEGSEGTFADYANYVADPDIYPKDITSIKYVIFYDDEGDVVLRFEAPEGGFNDAQDLIDEYDAAIAALDAPPEGTSTYDEDDDSIDEDENDDLVA